MKLIDICIYYGMKPNVLLINSRVKLNLMLMVQEFHMTPEFSNTAPSMSAQQVELVSASKE